MNVKLFLLGFVFVSGQSPRYMHTVGCFKRSIPKQIRHSFVIFVVHTQAYHIKCIYQSRFFAPNNSFCMLSFALCFSLCYCLLHANDRHLTLINICTSFDWIIYEHDDWKMQSKSNQFWMSFPFFFWVVIRSVTETINHSQTATA